MAFNIGFYAYAIIGHTWANQLLPQLLTEQLDTFRIQCTHIEHMHEGVCICNDGALMGRSTPTTAFNGAI